MNRALSIALIPESGNFDATNRESMERLKAYNMVQYNTSEPPNLDCSEPTFSDIFRYDNFSSISCSVEGASQISYMISFDFSKVLVGGNVTALPPAFWVAVYIGLTASDMDVVMNTTPVFLYPGSRLFGQAELFYRDVFKNAQLAALGLQIVSIFGSTTSTL